MSALNSSLQHHPLSWCPRLGGLYAALTQPQPSVVTKTQQHLMLTQSSELAWTLLSPMLGRKKHPWVSMHGSPCPLPPREKLKDAKRFIFLGLAQWQGISHIYCHTWRAKYFSVISALIWEKLKREGKKVFNFKPFSLASCSKNNSPSHELPTTLFARQLLDTRNGTY